MKFDIDDESIKASIRIGLMLNRMHHFSDLTK